MLFVSRSGMTWGFIPGFFFQFSFLVSIVCLYLFFGSEEYKGHCNLVVSLPTDTKFHYFSCFFWLLTEIFHMGKELNHITVHLLSLIQHPACHLAHSAVLASKGVPITLHSYWFNSLLVEKLRRNGCQRGKEKTRDSFSPVLLIRSSFRVFFFRFSSPWG